MEVITHDEAMARFGYRELVDRFDEQHRRPPAETLDSYLESSLGDGLLARTGCVPHEALGVKLASVFPRNVSVPTVHSVYVLFDGHTGEERAVILGNALTWYKTACDSALGARFLARHDVEHLVMVGAGSMAPHLVRAHLAVRPTLARVTIWNRTRARAEAVSRELAAGASIRVEVVDDLESAVRGADVVSCATMAVEPLIRGAWLRPGVHVDLVGSYKPAMREADDEVMRRGRLFVDHRGSAMDTGELQMPIAAGAIDADAVVGDLHELARGDVPGRSSADDITVFKNAGGGHLDLMAATFLVDR